MSAHLYIEGSKIGANSKEDQVRCREGFRKLLEKAGFAGRMPRLSACGGRGATFSDFKTAHKMANAGDYIAMLIDSEDPVSNLEKTWDHLKSRDGWEKPDGAIDDQVLLMTTCMETWIVADRPTLRAHYGHKLRESALPPTENLESRNRHEVHDKLELATKDCSNAYKKGKRSFEIFGKLNPSTLIADPDNPMVPSFARMSRILGTKL